MVSAALQICLAYYIIAILDPYIMSWQCLNRPIVVAPLAGLILGDFKTGIIMGASLESIFMGISAIGGSIPADATTSSIIAVAYTILTGADIEAGLAIALPIGTVMASIAGMFTPIWASLAAYWEKLAAECNPRKFAFQTIGFSCLTPLINVVILFFAVSYGVERVECLLGEHAGLGYDRVRGSDIDDVSGRLRDPDVDDLEQRSRHLLLRRLCSGGLLRYGNLADCNFRYGHCDHHVYGGKAQYRFKEFADGFGSENR